jgi:small ligand-binding sensory domain FIST
VSTLGSSRSRADLEPTGNTSLHCAAALSHTSDADLAAAEAADAAAVDLAAPCDLAVVFVGPDQLDALEAVGAAVTARLAPTVLVGAVAQGVIGPGEEVESGPAVAVFAAAGDGELHPFRAWAMRPPEGGLVVAGWPDTRPGDLTLVLADPFSFPATEVSARLGRERPGQPLVGGLVTGGPGRSALLLDDQVHRDGAVGVVLHGLGADGVVSQGCRPVGSPLTVTDAQHDRILELGGEPATVRLHELLAEVADDDRDRLQRGGLQIGLVVDEVRDAYGPGDFLVRGVRGIDPDAGALVITDLARVGQTVQFQVRDAAAADHDLDARLEGRDPAAGVLLFTCNGRGRSLFGHADHDVQAVEAWLEAPVAGAFCAGEIGPVGSGSYVHGFTASMVVLPREQPGPSGRV